MNIRRSVVVAVAVLLVLIIWVGIEVLRGRLAASPSNSRMADASFVVYWRGQLSESQLYHLGVVTQKHVHGARVGVIERGSLDFVRRLVGGDALPLGVTDGSPRALVLWSYRSRFVSVRRADGSMKIGCAGESDASLLSKDGVLLPQSSEIVVVTGVGNSDDLSIEAEWLSSEYAPPAPPPGAPAPPAQPPAHP